MSKLIPNRPTPLGRKAGELFGRLIDKSANELRDKFPDMQERCKSCAYRPGTIPNGCEETIMDAIKCAVELEPFYCHERFDKEGKPIDICQGWVIAISTTDAAKVRERCFPKAPWPYSHERTP